MNVNQQNIEEKILEYLDGQTTMKDKAAFELLLKTDDQIAERFNQLKLVYSVLHSSKLETPGADFTHRVMSNLHVGSVSLPTSPRNGIILLLGIGVAMMLGVILLSSGWFEQLTGVINLEALRLPIKIMDKQLPSIPYNGAFLLKLLIGLNLVIAFVLFDKTILQPYFRKRSLKHFH